MTNPMMREHDISQNKIIDREMTDNEFEQMQIDANAIQAKAQAEAQKSIDKTALLAKLGISESEAALLLS